MPTSKPDPAKPGPALHSTAPPHAPKAPSAPQQVAQVVLDAGLVALLADTQAESGRTLLALLDEQPMLLVFLRHFGCLSTRETLHSVARARPVLERRGVRPVFVHMGSPERAHTFFHRAHLDQAERVADPQLRLYTAPVFNLLKTTGVKNFTAPEAYWNLAKRSLLRHGLGAAAKGEDPTQLPGVFFLRDRAIHRAFRHRRISDHPDFARFGA